MQPGEASIVEEVRSMLEDLSCEVCDIVDNVAEHRGHVGSNGAAHLLMTLVSERFSGLGLLERERLVTGRFKSMIPDRIHAISLRCYAPDEFRSLDTSKSQ